MLFFFLYSSMKKNEKDSVDFWHRKMLKVRILLFSTFNSKTTERPKIFSWYFLACFVYLSTIKRQFISRVWLIYVNPKCPIINFHFYWQETLLSHFLVRIDPRSWKIKQKYTPRCFCVQEIFLHTRKTVTKSTRLSVQWTISGIR